MKGHELKCAVVSRMWRDGLTVSRKPADISTVAEYAVPTAEQAAAVNEIRNYMVPDSDCPVVLVSAGVIALEPDEEKVLAYLKRYCDDPEDIPFGLRE